MDEEKVKKILNKVDYLEGRWQDEREYEDWTDYVESMRKVVEKNGLVFKSAGKNPFGVVAEDEKHTHYFHVGGDNQMMHTSTTK